jgi:hypothetical protein
LVSHNCNWREIAVNIPNILDHLCESYIHHECVDNLEFLYNYQMRQKDRHNLVDENIKLTIVEKGLVDASSWDKQYTAQIVQSFFWLV